MPFKTLSKLMATRPKSQVQDDAPEYSLYDPCHIQESPPYEEQTSTILGSAIERPAALARTISESSYTSTELSDLLESATTSQQDNDEELPKYQATQGEWEGFLRSPSSVSVVSSNSRRAHSMCPCAQCHRMR